MLAEMLEAGQVHSVIDRTYPLSQAAEALRYLGTGHASGKVIIQVLDSRVGVVNDELISLERSMFRAMRRKKQLLSVEATEKILATGLVGVLGVAGDDDYPYTVPVNYAFENGKIYFHSAVNGHKLDGIQRNSKVSFCVIDRDEIVAQELTSYFRSAIAFGQAKIVSDEALKLHALEASGAANIRLGWMHGQRKPSNENGIIFAWWK